MKGTEHVACKTNIRKLSKILIRKLEGRNICKTGLKGRIILKSILERNSVRTMWTEFIEVRRGSGWGLL
jgi:hypothetical protein